LKDHGIPIDATPHDCPYLDGRTAVLPLRWYPQDVDPDTFDEMLSHADRRIGRHMYRPRCPSCTECKGIRIPVEDFAPRRSQRKVWNRNKDLRVTVGPPVVDKTRLDLFNRHKLERDLASRTTSDREYAGWLVRSCVRTVETRYWAGDKLVGVGIVDVGRTSASSVYFYFDPDESKRSLGVFSVMAEVRWAKQLGLNWYYLGLYVKGCGHLNYKAHYEPHERLEDGRWVRYGED
jgi:arginine-tRNA-protein transferase